MEDLRAARAPKPEKKENNTIRRKLEILDGAAASGKDLLEFCQDFNKASRARANQVRPARAAGLARTYRFFGACHVFSFASPKASAQRLSESGKRGRNR